MLLHGTVLSGVCRFGAAAASSAPVRVLLTSSYLSAGSISISSRQYVSLAASALLQPPQYHQPKAVIAYLSRNYYRRLVIPVKHQQTCRCTASSAAYNNLLFQATRSLSSEALAAVERPVDEPRRKMPSEKKPFHRLPSNVKPHHYKIELQPDLVGFNFDGKQDVFIEVSSSIYCLL